MLKIEQLSQRFGGIEALSDLDLDVAEGALYGLIGPNGSGKTTLFNLITGLYRPSSGRILLQDQPISGLKPHVIAAMGVARTFQNLRLYPRMTVFDNVWVAQHTLSDKAQKRREKVEHTLDQVGLLDRAEQLADSLPLPDQRRLELARAMIRSPKLLLLDEPAGGMTPAETAAMARLIREVAAPGRTCMIIEHKMDLIEALCNRLCVLNFGRKIADGEPQAVLQEPAVLEAYLGTETDA